MLPVSDGATGPPRCCACSLTRSGGRVPFPSVSSSCQMLSVPEDGSARSQPESCSQRKASFYAMPPVHLPLGDLSTRVHFKGNGFSRSNQERHRLV